MPTPFWAQCASSNVQAACGRAKVFMVRASAWPVNGEVIHVSGHAGYSTGCRLKTYRQHALQAAAVQEAAQGTKKLWGGRFTGQTDPLMEKFNESLPFDRRMWQEDIRASLPGTAPSLQHFATSSASRGAALQFLQPVHPTTARNTLARKSCCASCRAARRMQRPWQRLAC